MGEQRTRQEKWKSRQVQIGSAVDAELAAKLDRLLRLAGMSRPKFLEWAVQRWKEAGLDKGGES